MATVTITSTCSTNLTQAITFENNRADLREPSFSSYLNSSEEAFVLRLAESTWKPSNTISVSQEPVYSVNAGRKKTEDGEISIFGAEKYFNCAMDEEKTKTAENSRRMNQSKKVQMKSNCGTPSTCSELSSNSQNALLAGFSATPNRLFRQNSRRFFSTFSCKCPCSNKKSVDIGKNVAENKPTSITKKHLDCGKVHSNIKAQEEIPAGYIRTHEPWFKEKLPSQRFENLSLKSADREEYVSFPKSKFGTENIALQEKARNALELEVFGSPVLDNGDIGLNLQNKLTELNWDAKPRTDDHATSISIEIEDVRSDSSSDLFEIKTISDNSHPFFRSQETDGTSSCASPSSCYEPSEASIEWSVATASAANMSVVSEFGEQRSTNVTYTEKSGTNKEVPRRRSSTLLGCRSHKAVKVVAEAHKMKPEKVKSDPQRYHRSDSFKQVTRFQAETKVKDYESARVQRASATRSQAATVSHTLYMT